MLKNKLKSNQVRNSFKFQIKLYLFFLLLSVFSGCSNCKIEKDKTHSVAIPILKVLSIYATNNGIPKSFKYIKNFPYNLIPCSSNPSLQECKVLKNGYFFIKDNETYSIDLSWIGTQTDPKGFGLAIIHNTTDCAYEIYFNNKIMKNYISPSCSLIGHCEHFGKQ